MVGRSFPLSCPHLRPCSASRVACSSPFTGGLLTFFPPPSPSSLNVTFGFRVFWPFSLQQLAFTFFRRAYPSPFPPWPPLPPVASIPHPRRRQGTCVFFPFLDGAALIRNLSVPFPVPFFYRPSLPFAVRQFEKELCSLFCPIFTPALFSESL